MSSKKKEEKLEIDYLMDAQTLVGIVIDVIETGINLLNKSYYELEEYLKDVILPTSEHGAGDIIMMGHDNPISWYQRFEGFKESRVSLDTFPRYNRYMCHIGTDVCVYLHTHHLMSRRDAIEYWYSSKTYNKMIRDGLDLMSSAQAIIEVIYELDNRPEWMQSSGFYK